MKDEIRDELENSPFLRKMKERQTEGFQVPNNYFRHLPNEVMHKVKEPLPAPTPQLSWQERIGQFFQGLLQPGFALALASVVVLVVAGVIFFKDKNTTIAQPAVAEVKLEDISDEELFAYVSDNINDYNHEQVLEATGDKIPELKPKTKQPSLPKIKAPKPETKEIEEYLDQSIDEIDLEDLEEML
ncbi:MAG: hypothetical protein GC192_13025 [Bacteroidetes bacterium]|nr:hypothetical protein [Bacteroidota bacterium]